MMMMFVTTWGTARQVPLIGENYEEICGDSSSETQVPPQQMVLKPGSGAEFSQVLNVLKPKTTYSLHVTAHCSDGCASLPSKQVVSQTLPSCLGRGDRCQVNGFPEPCCEGTCISVVGDTGVCGSLQSLPTVSVSRTVENYTGNVTDFTDLRYRCRLILQIV